MSFNSYLFRGIRLLFFPVSLIVGLYIFIRNYLFDKGFFKPTSFNLPIICIGNLSVGGTGKSPMVELMLGMLLPQYNVAVLSRGYKRKTTGYVLAGEGTNALEIGDEPMQFFRKFPKASIAVGEKRAEAVPQLLHDRPDTRVILLDDAFQHRAIQAGFNIILTDYSNPYWHDTFLPTGDLRDLKSSARRADCIVVTKCPGDLNREGRQICLDYIKPVAKQELFFTTIAYGTPYHLFSKQLFAIQEDFEVLLVTGIANPEPLKKFLEQQVKAYFQKNYDDHHIFSIDDWNEIVEKFNEIDSPKKIILTTEKDAVRLEKFSGVSEDIPIYVIPVRHQILFEEEAKFEKMVLHFIDHFKQKEPGI